MAKFVFLSFSSSNRKTNSTDQRSPILNKENVVEIFKLKIIRMNQKLLGKGQTCRKNYTLRETETQRLVKKINGNATEKRMENACADADVISTPPQ